MVKSKFKIGQKLRVKELAVQMQTNGIKIGDIVTVTADAVCDYEPRVFVNGLTSHGSGFDDTRFEAVSDEPFKLEVGMRVRTADKGMFVVAQTTESHRERWTHVPKIVLVRNEGWLPVDFEREDDYRIIEVLSLPDYLGDFLRPNCYGKSLWSLAAAEEAKERAKEEAAAEVTEAEEVLAAAKAKLEALNK